MFESLVARDELGGGGESVVDRRVSQVVSQVLERALSGDDGLDEESEHGEHGKTSVLDLLHLELGEGIRVVSQTQGVEGTSRVEGVESLDTRGLSGGTESLGLSHQDNLAGGGGDDGLGVDQGRVSEVVESVISEDRGSGLEPDGRVAEVGNSVVLEQLRDEASQGSEHGPTGVDDLELPVLGKGLRIGRESSGIPAVVTRELSVQVGRAVSLGERSEPLGTVYGELNRRVVGELADERVKTELSENACMCRDAGWKPPRTRAEKSKETVVGS